MVAKNELGITLSKYTKKEKEKKRKTDKKRNQKKQFLKELLSITWNAFCYLDYFRH